MRIVGGTWRGRSFDAPQGRDTRPTTDRMRESIASSILSAEGLDMSGLVVLDAFAGSGGMGLELLSRGAGYCVFCERDGKAAALIKRNCKSLGAAPGTWRVVVGDVLRLPQRTSSDSRPFDIVFLDPPYAMPAEDVQGFVENLDEVGMLADRCLVVYERSTNGKGIAPAGFEEYRTKRHGGTSVDMLMKGALNEQ